MGTTYDDVVGLQFEGFGLEAFAAEPIVVDKCAVGTFDILDVNLESKVILVHRGRKKRQVGNYLSILFPYFGMLPAEDF